jgi:hypothetical protein
MSRPRKKASAAEGKRFGTTTIAPEKSMFDIQGVLTKYDAQASQWTVMPDAYTLRFRVNGRNYLMRIPRLDDDPQETRRLFRVVFWYLDTMLAAMDSGLFTPERVFLAFLEVAPDVTLSAVLEDPERIGAIRVALGGGQLALEAGDR